MRVLIVAFLLLSFSGFSQEDALAREYFKNGDFEKAVVSYKQLYDKSPNNYNYIQYLIKSYQQLEQYNKAEEILTFQLSRSRNPAFLVELGYNYQLKNDMENANKYYQEALAFIDQTPSYVYTLGKSFEDKALLDLAIATYEKGMQINPGLDFNIQLARIYGDQGNIEKMFDSYLDFVEKNDSYVNTIKRNFGEFITDDSDSENNQILKKILLKKIQTEPNLLWNEMLSWLFVQQKEYHKAFAQERAIFNRKPESFHRIKELALVADADKQHDKAIEIFTYISETAQDLETKLEANYYLLKIQIENSKPSDYTKISQQFQQIFDLYGVSPQTLELQILHAHFTAFYLHDTTQAISLLKGSLEMTLSGFQEAKIKMELADILVFEEKFNEALIYYTQIQRNLKNSTLSQEARYKVAKTSYYKGDFKWAESQLTILKSSTSQLIANDALDLMLLIRDNKYEDSTQTALKLYAKADLLAFQNKTNEAIALLANILENHTGKSIEDQALFKQAQLYEKTNQYDLAVANYQSIITNYADDILADDAYFHLAQLYNQVLDQPEKAKDLYENIVFNHQDSIYFVDARKAYRRLRGDDIN